MDTATIIAAVIVILAAVAILYFGSRLISGFVQFGSMVVSNPKAALIVIAIAAAAYAVASWTGAV